MLKKMLYRKIAVASSILVVMFMLYLIPTNKEEINVPQKLEYVYPNDLEVIYLLDDNNYLSRTKISANNKDNISKSIDLIEGLTIEGKKQDIIPNGFKSLIPKNTKILNITLENNLLTINFSKEFNNIKEEYEEMKLISGIVNSAKVLSPGIFMATSDEEDIITRTALSKAAEEILSTKGVQAVFVVGRTNNSEVSISARSLTDFNVQIIMERLGGGGHFSKAAAQRNSTSIAEVAGELEETVKIFLRDGGRV